MHFQFEQRFPALKLAGALRTVVAAFLVVAGVGCQHSAVRSFSFRQVLWASESGRQCVFKCKAQSHGCHSQCGGRDSGSLVWAGRFWGTVQTQTSGPAGCREQCVEMFAACSEGCSDVAVKPWRFAISVKCPDSEGCTEGQIDEVVKAMSMKEIADQSPQPAPENCLVIPNANVEAGGRIKDDRRQRVANDGDCWRFGICGRGECVVRNGYCEKR